MPMLKNDQTWSATVGNQTIEFATGKLAEQAGAAVIATAGETVVLATATVSKDAREGIDFLPFMVDFEEKFYAAGKINGSRFIKREGRPSENAILTSRLIDRPLRPLFPKTFRKDIQIIVTVLSLDEENDPDTLAINAASAALMRCANAPFQGPVAAVRIGRVNNELVVNPTKSQMLNSDLDLVVASTRDRVMMLEAGANELPDNELYDAIKLAVEAAQPCLDAQDQLAATAEVSTTVEEDVLATAFELVKSRINDRMKEVALIVDKTERDLAFDQLKQQTCEELEGELKQIDIAQAVDMLYNKNIRQNILDKDHRPDGRAITEVRPISVEVSVLPRPHGSAVFQRGASQSLSIVTLAGPGAKQLIDTMEEDTTKRYLHHYNFPPFSTGEVAPLRGTGRREIGHGALAERALLPVIPNEEDFPYTIRVVSEITSSNGSTSMAATCGSTMSLMDAGVPLKKPVSGIAMGLVTNEDASEFKVLTDLQGLEDFSGDMDFKIAGTADGITAVQMDTKIAGLTLPIVEQTIKQAKEGRLFIMEQMLTALPEPRTELSKYAPRIYTVKIDPAKIGELIGPGGKIINGIIERCGGAEVTQIDIAETGTVTITSTKPEMGDKAVTEVEGITKEIEVGTIYEGEVVDIVKQRDTGKEVGALVQIAPGKTGMIHVSEVSHQYLEKVSEVLSVGQQVKVKVLDVDNARGRIALSIKALQERPAGAPEDRPRGPRPTGPRTGGPRPPRPVGPRPVGPKPEGIPGKRFMERRTPRPPRDF